MQATQTQDTSTQAMTEVALGLSMAFFALLILALVSMGVPSTAPEQKSIQAAPDESLSVSRSDTGSHEQSAADGQFVFYHNTGLYTQTLEPFDNSDIDTEKPLYLAVPADLAFTQVMQLRTTINHPNLSKT
jgi:hypothetical protein